MLMIHNSLTKQKEVFTPIIPGQVKLYVCGMTVYDYCHIGHARSMSIFDTIVRYLRHSHYDVVYVRNITDIDDKIIKRAQENQEPWQALTERFIHAMHDDCAALHILPPSLEPRATETIAQMIAMIESLMIKGYAYVGSNGDVYFRVRQFDNYGKLAHKTLDDLQSGIRVSIAEAKENPLDFVLWKKAKAGEPAWDSPWGQGRPGWHIECSAMSTDLLGNHFDIHGGGNDLKFPHHENELAQSEAATGETFANYWIHGGMVTVSKEKMSKSLGNFFTIRDVLQQYHPEVIRFFLISSHYRSPVNYSEESLSLAKSSIERLYLCLRGLPEVAESALGQPYHEQFNIKMDDDFNTPEALAVLFDLSRQINKLKESDVTAAAELGATLRYLGHLLGILYTDPENYLTTQLTQQVTAEAIEALIADRQAARANRDWQAADKIRQQLTELGVLIEDNPQGTTWRWG